MLKIVCMFTYVVVLQYLQIALNIWADSESDYKFSFCYSDYPNIHVYFSYCFEIQKKIFFFNLYYNQIGKNFAQTKRENINF